MSQTKQPKWRFLGNLGDKDPFISAALVYLDMTGVYEPEIVLFNEDDMVNGKYNVYRFTLDRCSMQNCKPETISDNRFHSDKPAWFASKLKAIAETSDFELNTLAAFLVANDPLKRAEAYMAIVAHNGAFEFDSRPCEMTRAEIRKRYRAAFPRRKRASTIEDKRQLVLDTGI